MHKNPEIFMPNTIAAAAAAATAAAGAASAAPGSPPANPFAYQPLLRGVVAV